MCGIISAFNYGEKKGPANEWVMNRYQDQYERGQKGFGLITIDQKTKKVEVKRSTLETKALLDLQANESNMIIFHHRMPSSTPNKLSQTHPIEVDNGSLKHKYLVIHNGIISNDDTLKIMHEKDLGFTYRTQMTVISRFGTGSNYEQFNDSEALAIELARYIEKQSDEMGAEGGAAFVVLQIDKKTNKALRVYFGRFHNPLRYSQTHGQIRIASEDVGQECEEDMLYYFDVDDSFKIKKEPLKRTIRPVVTTVPVHTVSGFQPPSGNYLPTSASPRQTTLPYGKHSADKVDPDKPYGGRSSIFEGDDEILTEEDHIELFGEDIESELDIHRQEIDDVVTKFFNDLADEDQVFNSDDEGTIRRVILNVKIAKNKAQQLWSDFMLKRYDPTTTEPIPDEKADISETNTEVRPETIPTTPKVERTMDKG